eukprot:scaffold8218_cov151-Skeletonema_marinoi.AAC.1
MKAGEKALDGCDHNTAYSYLGAALSLLPNDHWKSHYDLSLRLNFLTSSAANSCCQYDEAEQILRRGLANARCLYDQLPSYLLLSQILQAQGKVKDVYDTCSAILTELGESIPECYTLSKSSVMLVETLKMYEEVGDNRIAKGAMSLQERFDVSAQIPELYFNFYGRIAWRFEPFQAGIEPLRQGFEAGLSSGNKDMGLHCLIHTVKNALFSGASLKSTLKEIDYNLHLLKTYKSEVTNNFMLNFRETVSLLIDNGEATSIPEKAVFGDLNDPGNKPREAFFHHAVIRAYWSGYTERCGYCIQKCMNLFGQGAQPIACVAKFFFGKLQP